MVLRRLGWANDAITFSARTDDTIAPGPLAELARLFAAYPMAKTAPKTPQPTTATKQRNAPAKHLQVFPNPNPERDYVIEFQIPEFTCHCPLTGQPDFAHFTIAMVADKLCVELKSLKMYVWGFRDVGAFHEKVTNQVLDEIVSATVPRFVRITAKWNVRGGIYTNVVAEYRKQDWTPQPVIALPGPVGLPN